MLNTRLVDEAVNKSGGEKKSLQRMVLNGQIDQLTATIAAMRIDRIRNAAKLDQLNQPTVAEQVLNPQAQPQVAQQGMAAMPQAQQMPPQAQMGQPAQQPMMAARGGMLEIPYNEGDYAEGGIVSFAVGGGYGETMAQLRRQLGAARTQAQRDQITAAMNQLRAQYEQPSLQPNMSTGPQREGLAAVDTSDPMAIGMETFDDNRPDQGQRIDPNRFRTGTLTEAGARATADSGFDNTSLSKNIANPFAAVYDTVVGLPAAVLQNAVEFGKSKITGDEPEYVTSAPAQTALFGQEPSVEVPSIAGRRGLGGTKEAQDLMLQDATPLTQAQLDAQASKINLAERRANPTFDLLDLIKGRRFKDNTPSKGRIITDPAEIASLKASPEGRAQEASGVEDRRGTLEEQVARMRQAAQDPFASQQEAVPETVADQVKQTEEAASAVNTQRSSAEQAAASEQVGVAAPAEKEEGVGSFPADLQAQFDEQYKALAPQTYDDFAKTAQQFMPETEYGEYRKEIEALLKDREGTMKRAKKDSFNMALVQAGLGLMAQGGGQTALQALGKAAMPAVSQYAKDVKDLKKEDRELLRLGLSLEQMDAKEKAATKRMMYQMYSKQEADKKVARAGMLKTQYAGEKSIQAAQINASRTSAESQLLESMGPEAYAAHQIKKAAAGAAQSGNTAAMRDYARDVQKAENAINDAFAAVDKIVIVPPDVKRSNPNITLEEYKAQERTRIRGQYRMPDPALYGIQVPTSTGGQTQTQGTPLPANPTAATLQKGTVYQTSRGPARWNGTQFELVQ